MHAQLSVKIKIFPTEQYLTIILPFQKESHKTIDERRFDLKSDRRIFGDQSGVPFIGFAWLCVSASQPWANKKYIFSLFLFPI